jgi:hypothetical protein
MGYLTCVYEILMTPALRLLVRCDDLLDLLDVICRVGGK